MFLTRWLALIGVFLGTAILDTGYSGAGKGVSAGEATEPAKTSADPAAASTGPDRTDLVKVASPVAGIVWFVGTEIKPGEQVPPVQIFSITIGGEVKKYRRLKKGDRVEEGQLLARLDDRLARAEYAIQQKKVEQAEADFKAARAVQDECKARWEAVMKRLGGKTGLFVGSNQEERDSLLQFKAAGLRAEGKQKAAEVAKLELKKAQTVLEMHEIRARTSGVIQAIAKHPGEAVKKFETVFVIRVADR